MERNPDFPNGNVTALFYLRTLRHYWWNWLTRPITHPSTPGPCSPNLHMPKQRREWMRATGHGRSFPAYESASFLHLWLWGFAEAETRWVPRCKETCSHNWDWGKEELHPGNPSNVPGTSYWPNAEPIPMAGGVKTLWLGSMGYCRGKWDQPNPTHMSQALDWNSLGEQRGAGVLEWVVSESLCLLCPRPFLSFTPRAQAENMGGALFLLPLSISVHSDLCLWQRSRPGGQQGPRTSIVYKQIIIFCIFW